MMTIIANTNNEIIAYDADKDIAINMAINIIKAKNTSKENIIHVTSDNIFVIKSPGLFTAEISDLYQIIDIDYYVKGNYVIISSAAKNNAVVTNTINYAYEIIREYVKNKYNFTEKNHYSDNGKILMPDNGVIESSYFFSIDNEDTLDIEEEIFILV